MTLDKDSETYSATMRHTLLVKQGNNQCVTLMRELTLETIKNMILLPDDYQQAMMRYIDVVLEYVQESKLYVKVVFSGKDPQLESLSHSQLERLFHADHKSNLYSFRVSNALVKVLRRAGRHIVGLGVRNRPIDYFFIGVRWLTPPSIIRKRHLSALQQQRNRPSRKIPPGILFDPPEPAEQ